jgi:hypothetical protein
MKMYAAARRARIPRMITMIRDMRTRLLSNAAAPRSSKAGLGKDKDGKVRESKSAVHRY